MKVYAVYFEKGEDGEFRRPAGDRSIVILDGRKTVKNLVKDALDESGHKRPEYDAVALYTGVNLLNHLHSITGLIDIPSGETIGVAPEEI